MTRQVHEQAEKYVQRSLKSQERLGYSGRVEGDVYGSAVRETARAVNRLMRAQRRSRSAA